jgi:ABC-2 type transport system ATP-binding protein
MTEPVLELRGVAKTYDGHQAVVALDLAVPPACLYGLLGPNGAGKTTTIRMIMGILLPDQGEVRIEGAAFRPELRRRIGYLPEERGLYPKMKVRDQLEFFAGLQGVSRAERRPRIAGWLERFDLAAWAEKKVEELSKGMQQKVQLIATLLHRPPLLILDEPFAGLDPVNAKLLKDVLLEQVKAGCTVVLSTHRMEQVEQMCDAICLIDRGRKVLDGRVDAIKARYGHNTVQVEFDGDDRQLAALPGVERVESYGRYAEVRLADGADAQALLQALAGKVRVRRFEITTPSINDIFIDQVGRAPASAGH